MSRNIPAGARILRPPGTRPDLAFRVGVTGTRDLAGDQCARLAGQLRGLLGLIRTATMREAAAGEAVSPVFRRQEDGSCAPLLRFLSPLARGADRLAARVALDEGYALHVPMPFARAVYEQDFASEADLAEFRALLEQAGSDWTELDGDRDLARAGSYEAAGRYVVRNCDLLVAIWDGDQESGRRGGTADIVRYAASGAVPIWWLHAERDIPPVWLADIQDLRDPQEAPAAAEASLLAHLGALVRPPPPCHRHLHGLTDWIAHAGQGAHVSPMAEYFTRSPLASGFVWQAYDRAMRLLAGPAGPDKPLAAAGSLPARDEVAAFWAARFAPADLLAMRYADRYRSGYVWTFAFGTLSVALGACALVCSLLDPGSASLERWTTGFAAGELAMLLLILLLVGCGLRGDWHEHSIEFRLLAELCRKQQALGPLGWALPITDVRRMNETDDAVPERGAWVAWLFAADQRAAPFPTGALAEAAQGPPRRVILDELIASQRAYHAGRARRDGAGGRLLAVIGERFFFAVLLLVLVKLGLEIGTRFAGRAWPLGLLATVLPAFSAAFVGIRAYSEIPLLAVQSQHMEAVLKAAHDRVDRLDKPRPLLSQDLGAEAASVATLMLQDLEGWARLFRVKSLEAG